MGPERIGRYEVRGRAGSGGFASVYEGFDPRLDARVAIKVLADNWSGDPEIRRRFRQEAVLLRRMQTEDGVPGLIEVFDIDETPTGQPYFVMGWAGGGTLAARAGDRAWAGELVVPVIVALTQSLGHLHARGLVHRDIKPQNLLLRSERTEQLDNDMLIAPGERLVLGDFGLAKDLAADVSTLSLVGGTERYMPPEQLVFGGPVDHRADIYAATAMISDLLTGRGKQPLSPALQAAVIKGGAHAPADRYASMAEWQAAFLTAVSDSEDFALEPGTVGSPWARDASPVAAPAIGSAGTPLDPSATEITSGDDRGARQPDPKQRDRQRWMLGAGATLLGACLIAVLVLRDSAETIVGPATLASGETATYRIDDPDASGVVWTGPGGARHDSPTLEVTGRLPGQLTISAAVDGSEYTRTMTVEESSLGPQITGPSVVRRGEQGIFRADVPTGQSFFWIHPTRGRVQGADLPVVQAGEEFIVGLVSIDANGIERGDQMLVTSG